MHTRHIFTALTAFFAFVTLLLFSLLGVILPEALPVVPVGVMQIAPYGNGLSLFQGFRGGYMTASPFNDYVIKNNVRESLIPQEQFAKKLYTRSTHSSLVRDLWQGTLGYFGAAVPEVWYDYNGTRITYRALTDGNSVRIVRTVATPEDESLRTGITLSFDDKSFIFDENNRLYMFKTNEEIAQASRIFKRRFTLGTVGAVREAIQGTTVYIENPAIPGVVAIQAQPGQQLIINRNARLIEIEETVTPVDNEYSTTAHITVIAPEEMER